jgi:hypothetical protein
MMTVGEAYEILGKMISEGKAFHKIRTYSEMSGHSDSMADCSLAEGHSETRGMNGEDYLEIVAE